MKISLNWLKQYVDLPKNITPDQLGVDLTLKSVEIEGVESQGADLDNIIVAKITELKPHPNADKLRIAVVDDGEHNVQVVCGGSNLEVGMLVAFARVGSRVRWHGEGELVTLAKVKLRGEDSSGMICTSSEVGLGGIFPAKEESEILDLTEQSFKVGQSIAEALNLNDTLLDLDNKAITNRPDMWGHYGIAREVAAIYNKKIDKYKVKDIKTEKLEELSVEIQDPELCRRYLGVVIDGVKVGPSSDWLVERLQSVGQKSINNIVDITNYILYDLGQPMHAFDAGLISDNKIIVRRAEKGEKFTTLDEEERKLTEENLVIADGDKAVALAGVMGGLNSEIKNETTKVILESANFEPFSIRKTAESLGLRTESSTRFEKNLDPAMAELALKKAVELILDCCPEAKVISPVVDEYPTKIETVKIEVGFDFINKRIGVQLEKKEIEKILDRLGFDLKAKGDKLIVTVPSWRATKDISIAEDIVEEVARMYGYDNIEPQMPAVPLCIPHQNIERELERKIKNILVKACGATEVHNYSFVGDDEIKNLGLDVKKYVELENPLTADQNLLRRELFSGLLNNVVDNLRFYPELNIFEIGHVYLAEQPGHEAGPDSQGVLPDQPSIAGGMTVCKDDSFMAAKKCLETTMTEMQLDFKAYREKEVPAWIHPKRYLPYYVGDKQIAYVGEVHPSISNGMDIDQRVAFWRVDLSAVSELYNRQYKYQLVNKFPSVELDASITLDEKVTWQEVEQIVHSAAPQFIKKIVLFDVYKSDKIGVDKKSLAFHVVYQSEDRTLESAEVQKMHDTMLSQLAKSVKAVVRK
ncbi:phenylalanine--tRNA ligase subunit beta [Candidatus Falkowbacteria bacterium CG10_big_fil_rev_8_21_14_0_10_39_11]|uniref:Phenylalanine--tRNA ligase beta subunit n=1 Tax=Candidatus Falkowbacteria bacterium CG10_big_fil_rev_8_21_14_0_10_39_11 TaxID=1974565 RepID=A0A2H0V461_9BACT|nr:MAG: phenylalanine--tRNA ligase subunit beta [Candidatus Falkowbacteria bacterium CG10_big_fil_rev_8_21_14_0_10_39_11]